MLEGTKICPSEFEAPDEGGRVRGGLIIVGPGRHFGYELVKRFAIEGMTIGIITSNRNSADDLASMFTAQGLTIHYEIADIGDVAEFSSALLNLTQKIKSVSCVIYNPKISIKSSGLNTTPQELNSSIAVNVTGALVAIQAMVPLMDSQSSPCIILTGGGYKDFPDVERFALSVGKAGLHGLARSLKAPLNNRGIRLMTVVIDGMVRRTANEDTSSKSLADFYWTVFSNKNGNVFRFPKGIRIDQKDQLTLFP